MKIRCVLDAIEEFAPRALQENWDNAGLQAGDAAKDCTGVLLTLDVNGRTVDEARECGCNLIISHHPLIFKGIKSVTPDSPVGRILLDALRHGIAVYAAHTNLDNARFGVSHRMAQKIGMTDIRVLQPQEGRLVKLVVFAPENHASAVTAALHAAGAGHIGDYDRCAYAMQGIGSFRPLDGANPFAGCRGEIHREPETRIEVILPSWAVGKAVKEMIAVHPYEEPAFDVLPLSNADAYCGSGAVGNVAPVQAGMLIGRLKELFGTPSVRFSGDPAAEVRRIALCGGSGAFLAEEAVRAGADIYITGDLKYHDFTAMSGRIMLADIGHFESEQCSKEIFRDVIGGKFPDLAVRFANTDINTINYI